MIVLAVALLLFGGKGKISNLMGDVAQGVKAFKKGLADDEAPAAKPAEPPRELTADAPAAAASASAPKSEDAAKH
jgi:sec-independent protein translocase protein TatA